MPTIDPDKVCHVIVKARALSAKTDVGIDDEASNMVDDGMLEVLEAGVEDATDQELTEFIESLNIDEQIELVALAWIGRGSFTRDEWQEAVREARQAHGRRTAEYLMGMPLLGDYLADGLAEFGHTCDE
ncbi:MAG: DUF3775 domain-containing protein [Geminicoccaceae bacterium]